MTACLMVLFQIMEYAEVIAADFQNETQSHRDLIDGTDKQNLLYLTLNRIMKDNLKTGTNLVPVP